MTDLADHGLFEKLSARKVTGDHLETMGKSAAAKWQSGEYPNLTDAVIGVVKEASLSTEQVRRVIEFANTEAYLTEFKKEGSPSKYVDFPGGPADPSEVIKALNISGSDTFSYGASDYHQPPKEKVAFAVSEEAFFGQLKAAQEYPDAEPLSEALDAREKLAGIFDHMTTDLSAMEMDCRVVADAMYGHVKQAAMSGHSMGEVVQAWSEVAEDPTYVKIAFAYMTPRLVADGVYQHDTDVHDSLQKTAASKVVNTGHPIVSSFYEFQDTLSKLAQLRATRDEVGSGLQELESFFVQAGKVKEASLWQSSKDLAHLAGGATRQVVGGAGEAILGHGHGQAIGDLAGKAVELTPEAGALYLGLKGMNTIRNMRNNSVVAEGLSEVPGTQEHYMKYGW